MIAYSKDTFVPRFNPVLGSSYEMNIVANEITSEAFYIEFKDSNGHYKKWYFKTLEAAEQTIEWLDQLYGVKFIPNEILKQENKEND